MTEPLLNTGEQGHLPCGEPGTSNKIFEIKESAGQKD